MRRGEESDLLSKRRNWKEDNSFNFVDLNYMARFFRFFNITGASQAYIERIVPSFEESSEELYPVPASVKNFEKSLNIPK